MTCILRVLSIKVIIISHPQEIITYLIIIRIGNSHQLQIIYIIMRLGLLRFIFVNVLRSKGIKWYQI
jgi:hypothetical protein